MNRNDVVRLLTAVVMLAGTVGTARSNDLSNSPCTAGDVEIIGSGFVANEPCTCPASGKFDATVQFTVRNNTSTGRYCIALHLVPDGGVLTAPYDVVLRDASGKSVAPGKSGGEPYHDTVMYGTIPNFPCNVGQVCFGQTGIVKGKCAPGACTTVSWNTSNGAMNCTLADENPPGGQCRHQQVCVIGFGATLNCTANCNVTCGGTATLRGCAVGPASRGPYTLALAGSDGSTQTQSGFGDATGAICANFTVSPTQSPTTTYTLTVTDREGCTRTATASVGVTPTVVTITPAANTGCNGIMTYTASVNGQTGCGFTWEIDGVAPSAFATGGATDDARVARVGGTSSQTLELRALDGVCHTITARASCSNGTQTPCTGTATTSARQCVTSTQSCK